MADYGGDLQSLQLRILQLEQRNREAQLEVLNAGRLRALVRLSDGSRFCTADADARPTSWTVLARAYDVEYVLHVDSWFVCFSLSAPLLCRS